MVAPNFGDGNKSGSGNDGYGNGSDDISQFKNGTVKVFHPILGWIDIAKVKKWSFTTFKMPKSEFDGMVPSKSPKPDDVEPVKWNPADIQEIKKNLDSGVKHPPMTDGKLKEMFKAALAKYNGSFMNKTPFSLTSIQESSDQLASHKSPATVSAKKPGVDPNYLRKLYSRIDRKREQSTVRLANHKPSRERIVYDAIVTNESGNRVVEPVELFVVSGRAGRVTFARPLAYLRSPFRIEDKSIRGDLRKLNLDGVYVTTDPANAEVVESMVDEISAGVRFAIYERNVGDELRLEATLRLEEGGYVLPERGEFDGGQDSWKCASERFWALLERVYWECVAVVGGSEVN